jgi:hypothetical protein
VRALAFALAAPKRRDRLQRSTEIDRRLLEDLLADLVTPDQACLRARERTSRAINVASGVWA